MDIDTQRRMLEIAGMTGSVLTEASKKIVKEDAQTSIARKFGNLGAAVAEQLDHYKFMATDDGMEDELQVDHMSPENMRGFIEDMIDDQLAEIFESPEYKQLCTEIAGQYSQKSADPAQRQLDV